MTFSVNEQIFVVQKMIKEFFKGSEIICAQVNCLSPVFNRIVRSGNCFVISKIFLILQEFLKSIA